MYFILNWITIYDADVSIKAFKRERTVIHNPSVVDVVFSYIYRNPSIYWLSVAARWIDVDACHRKDRGYFYCISFLWWLENPSWTRFPMVHEPWRQSQCQRYHFPHLDRAVLRRWNCQSWSSWITSEARWKIRCGSPLLYHWTVYT